MKKVLQFIVIALPILAYNPIYANEAIYTFSSCMVDNLNGKERKGLAKWIFFAVAAHPEMRRYSKITEKDREMSDQYVGELVTRLLVEDCPMELKAANKVDPMAIEKAFEFVGEVAMQELMTSEDVMKAVTNFGQYADQDKINKVLSQ